MHTGVFVTQTLCTEEKQGERCVIIHGVRSLNTFSEENSKLLHGNVGTLYNIKSSRIVSFAINTIMHFM